MTWPAESKLDEIAEAVEAHIGHNGAGGFKVYYAKNVIRALVDLGYLAAVSEGQDEAEARAESVAEELERLANMNIWVGRSRPHDSAVRLRSLAAQLRGEESAL